MVAPAASTATKGSGLDEFLRVAAISLGFRSLSHLGESDLRAAATIYRAGSASALR